MEEGGPRNTWQVGLLMNLCLSLLLNKGGDIIILGWVEAACFKEGKIHLSFPIFFKLQLPHFCYKTISILHIWKAYDAYFLNAFVGKAPFPKKDITFGWLGYLEPNRVSRWLILKLILMPWQKALQTMHTSTSKDQISKLAQKPGESGGKRGNPG